MGCQPRHRRKFRRGCGKVDATINNRLEFDKLVENSISVTISIEGDFNVRATNSGSANALCESDENTINNDD